MAHAVYEGRAVFGRNTPAWHREGTVLPGLLTALQVREHVDPPKIDTVPTYYPVYDEYGQSERYVQAKGFNLTTAHWSDGRIVPLGQVTDKWKPVQFDAAFRIFDPIIKDMGAVFDAAGVLEGGRSFWCLAHLPENFTLEGTSDRMERYLLFTTRNDGTGSVIVKVCWIRVVCANTLSMALSNKRGEIRIRHSGDVDAKIDEATRIIEDAWLSFKEGEKQFELMKDKILTKDERAKLVTDVLGIDVNKELSTRATNILGDVANLFKFGLGAQGDTGVDHHSLWHTFNTLTEYVDHKRTVRGGSGRLNSTQFGSGAQVKEKAYKECVKLLADGTEVMEKVEVEEDEGGSFSDLLDKPFKNGG